MADGYTSPWLEEKLNRRQQMGMKNEGHFGSLKDESPFSVMELLKACTATKDLYKGSRLHAHIREHNLLGKNIYIGSTLVNMYAKCGALCEAQHTLEELPVRNVITWNALIAGYAQQGKAEEALKCFDDMLSEGHHPTTVTLACALKACGGIKAAAKGKEIHDTIVRLGMLKKDIVVGTALVDMYAKCGNLAKAQQVHKELPVRDVVSWSSLITGYAENGQGEKALECFNDMLHEGHSPTAVTFLSVLKACKSMRTAAKGEEIHDKIVTLGMLEKDILLGTTMVDMYAKCGVLVKAQQVFEELPMRDVVSWSALISGYAEQGQEEEALKYFDYMLCEGHSPTAVTFICALKACGSAGTAAKGEDIHGKINRVGMLGKDIALGNSLVDMYAKCNAFAKARQVLDNLPFRDVLSWNTLIAGYAQEGQGEEALKCFYDMLCEGHSPTAVTFASVLKACGSIRAVVKGKEIHDRIVNSHLFEKDAILGNSLVDMYAKCGALGKAHQVLEELPVRDVFSWTILVVGYAAEGQEEESLKCFDDMLCEGHSPTAVTFAGALKACGGIGVIAKGEEMHDKILSLGFLEKDVLLGNSLVDMYVKCGALSNAQQVLRKLSSRDVITWNILIAGYAEQGQGEEALKCFDDMLHEEHSPTVVTFIFVLKACGSTGAAAKGKEIYDRILSLDMVEKDIVLGNALVDMYVKCGALAKAQQVLEGLPIRDAISWNMLIAGYAQRGQGEEALKCFNDMLHEGHSPNVVTFACILKACGGIRAAVKGEMIHDKFVSLGVLKKDIVLGTTLVDMYVKCGMLAKAQKEHEELPLHDVVSWSALIAGYTKQGQGEEALKCFDDMLCEGHSPTVATFVCVLKACGSIGVAAKGEEIHNKIVSLGLLEKDIVLGSSLVDMYVKCGALSKAQEVLKELPVQNVVTWNALIAGYAEQGQGEKALKCLDDMLCDGQAPTAVTFICALKACGNIGAAAKGEEIHHKIVSLAMLDKDLVLGTTLVSMYAKCSALTKAQQMHEELPVCDVVSWTALIAGYALQGQGEEALKCFQRMQSNGVKPNLITLTSLLTACSHSGLLDKAETCFSGLITKYGLHPNLVLYCCMTDAFSRAGKFNKALSMIAEMPSDKWLPSWLALLGACRKWGEVKTGQLAFERALGLDKHNTAVCMLMVSIYTSAGMEAEAHKIEAMRSKVLRWPGCF